MKFWHSAWWRKYTRTRLYIADALNAAWFTWEAVRGSWNIIFPALIFSINLLVKIGEDRDA